jgi:hypothetical protein
MTAKKIETKEVPKRLRVKSALRAGYADVQAEPVVVDGYQPQYH